MEVTRVRSYFYDRDRWVVEEGDQKERKKKVSQSLFVHYVVRDDEKWRKTGRRKRRKVEYQGKREREILSFYIKIERSATSL